MAGKFELYTDKAGEYRFRLKASNGETIGASEGYKAKSGATNGIKSVKKNSKDAGRFETFEGNNGQTLFQTEGRERRDHSPISGICFIGWGDQRRRIRHETCAGRGNRRGLGLAHPCDQGHESLNSGLH